MHLVSGQVGSGKSTELLRLQHELQAGEGGKPRLRVVYVDALEYLSISDLDFSWVLLALLSALGEEFGPVARSTQFFQAALDDLRRVIESAQLNLGVQLDGGLTRLTGALRSDAHARRQLRLRLAPMAEQLIDRVNGLAGELREAVVREGYTDLVFVVDNLEKIVPTPVEHTGRDSYETTYFDGAPLFRRLDLHLVLTVPAALCYRDMNVASLPVLYGQAPHIVPTVRVKPRSGEGDAGGVDALMLMLGRRFDIDVLFNGDRGLVRDLCRMSGGSVRRLFQLVTEVSLEVEQPPILREDVERVRRRMVGLHYAGLPSEYLDVLAEVAETHAFPSSSDEDDRTKGHCLQNLVVMEYNGEGRWYDVDPLLWGLKRFQEAVAKRGSGAEE